MSRTVRARPGRGAEPAIGRGSIADAMRAIAQVASDAVVTVDRSGAIIDANPALTAMFGHAAHSILGRPVTILLAESERGSHRDVHERLMTSGDPDSIGRLAQLRGVRADGQEFAMEVSRTLWSAGGETFATAVIRNLTARWRAEDSAAQWGALVGSSPSAIVRLGLDGRIESWNSGAAQLCGLAAREAIGQLITILEPPGAGVHGETVRAAGAGATVKCETVIARRDGLQLDVHVSASPILSPRREIIGVLWVARDISERKRTDRELSRLADAAQHGTDAVVSIDLEGRIRHWSKGAATLYGFTAVEAIGRDFRGLTRVAEEPSVNTAEVMAGAPSHQYEVRRRRKDGTVIDVLATVIPWRVDGEMVGITGIGIDITDRKRAERELARLAEAAECGTDSVVSIDLEGRVCHWNHGAERIYGFTAAEAIGADLRQLTMVADEEAAFAEVLTGAPGHQLEVRRRRKDGTVIDVLLSAGPWHVDGRVVGATAVGIDITERRRAEATLRQNEQRLRTIFEGAPIGVALARATAPFELVQANASLAAMLGATPAELAGRGAATLIDPSERENAHAHLQGLACGEPCSSPVELTLRAGAGEPLCVSVHGAMIAGADGAPEHLVLQLQDITERKSLELELRRSAERDPLTGLLNRRGMSRELTRAMADHQRYGTPATLLACDLDNLKPVNDTLGHQAGDELLTGVAQTLSEQVRDTDVVARMGGDEFLVLLAHTGPRQAGAMAQRLQTAVRTLTPKGMPPTSISVGMAALGDGLSAEDAVIAADLAMYEAKRQGPSRMGVSRPIPRARDHDDSTCTIGRQ